MQTTDAFELTHVAHSVVCSAANFLPKDNKCCCSTTQQRSVREHPTKRITPPKSGTCRRNKTSHFLSLFSEQTIRFFTPQFLTCHSLFFTTLQVVWCTQQPPAQNTAVCATTPSLRRVTMQLWSRRWTRTSCSPSEATHEQDPPLACQEALQHQRHVLCFGGVMSCTGSQEAPTEGCQGPSRADRSTCLAEHVTFALKREATQACRVLQ